MRYSSSESVSVVQEYKRADCHILLHCTWASHIWNIVYALVVFEWVQRGQVGNKIVIFGI